jgi:hypothetical protein
LDDELAHGDEIRETRVLGAEVGLAFLLDEAFQGGLAVDEGGDDVMVARFAAFEDDGITIADVGVDHRVATDFQGEGISLASNPKGSDIDGKATFLFLLLILLVVYYFLLHPHPILLDFQNKKHKLHLHLLHQ